MSETAARGDRSVCSVWDMRPVRRLPLRHDVLFLSPAVRYCQTKSHRLNKLNVAYRYLKGEDFECALGLLYVFCSVFLVGKELRGAL